MNALLSTLDYHISKKRVLTSLCVEISEMTSIPVYQFTIEDSNKLKIYFLSQKPTWYRNTRFWLSPLYTGKTFWWTASNMPGSTRQRKLFITHLVKKTF